MRILLILMTLLFSACGSYKESDSEIEKGDYRLLIYKRLTKAAPALSIHKVTNLYEVVARDYNFIINDLAVEMLINNVNNYDLSLIAKNVTIILVNKFMKSSHNCKIAIRDMFIQNTKIINFETHLELPTPLINRIINYK